MKKAPSIYSLQQLLDNNNVLACINGRWLPARPLGYFSILHRVRCAWLAFTGEVDLVIWPGNQ